MRELFFTFLLIILTLRINAQIIDRVVAVVGEEIVLTSDLETQYLQYVSQGAIDSEEIRCQIFEELLFQKLLLHKAELDSIEINPEEVSEEVENRINYYVREIGSIEKMETFFNKNITDIRDQLNEMVYEQYMAQRMRSKITKDVNITPSEIRLFYDQLQESEKPFIESEVVLLQLVIKPEISIIERDRVREQLNTFRERVSKGEDFKVLAALYSDDPGSSNSGGELGFLNRGDLVPEFEKVAFRLKEGEISEVVESQYGYHIIQLIERRGEQINVRHILLKPKTSSSALLSTKKKIEEIENELNTQKISFTDAVKKYSDDESKNNGGLMINQKTGNTSFIINNLDPSLKYIVENLEKGQYSKPIKIQQEDGGSAYQIVYIKQKNLSHTANLEDDYDIFQQAALSSMKQERINNWIDKNLENTYIRMIGEFSRCEMSFKWSQ